MDGALEKTKDGLASIQTLMDYVDDIPDDIRPGHPEEQPVFWPIEQTGNIPNRGTFVAGRLPCKLENLRIMYA